MRFNINNKVRVRLTPRGHELFRQHFVDLGIGANYRRPDEDANGWSTWTAWDLMSVFGRHLRIGLFNEALPFEPTIELLEEQR